MRLGIVSSVITVCMSALFVSPNALGGTRDGGGGVGVQCMTSQGKTLQLLDLYEAQSRGLSLLNEPANAQSALDLISSLIAEHFWNVDTIPVDQLTSDIDNTIITPIYFGRSWFNDQTKRSESVEYVSSLKLSDDIGTYHIQPNCKLIQIAYYDDQTTTLKIVKTLWEKLSLLNRVALEAHEIIYLIERRYDAEKSLMTSQSSRELVGELLSTSGAVPEFPRSTDWTCYNQSLGQGMSYFYISRLSDGTWGLYFTTLMGSESAFQIFANIPGISIENLLNVQNPYSTTLTVPVNFVGDSFAPHLSMTIAKATSGYPTIQFFENSASGSSSLGPAEQFNCRR